jgi:hypothetical protein
MTGRSRIEVKAIVKDSRDAVETALETVSQMKWSKVTCVLAGSSTYNLFSDRYDHQRRVNLLDPVRPLTPSPLDRSCSLLSSGQRPRRTCPYLYPSLLVSKLQSKSEKLLQRRG